MKRNCRSIGPQRRGRWATRADRGKTPRLLSLPSYNRVFASLFPKLVLEIKTGFLGQVRHAIVTVVLASGQPGVI